MRPRRLPGYVWLLGAYLLCDTTGVSPTLADAPPPRGYVEQCTIPRVQQGHEFCTICAS
jgi:hypothetical protein